MRIVRIEIERLLGFRSLKMDIDSSLQLVAGPNNAGKSSLIRILEAFFSDPTGAELTQLKPLNEYYANLGSRTLSSIQVWFGELSSEERRTFAPILRQDGKIWVGLRSSRSGTLSFQASRNANADTSQRLYKEVVAAFRFVKIPSVRVGNVGGKEEPESLERLLDTLEAVLIRSGASRSTALQQDFAAKIAPLEALVKSVLDDSAAAIASELPFREQTVSIDLPESRHALRGMLESAVLKSRDEIDIPISERGTGFQSALVLGILRYVADREGSQAGHNLMFAIEEPEAFLHPQTQRAMAKILRDIAGDAQLLVTTHSSVLVDSFEIGRIARIPLQSGGTEHVWTTPSLAPTDVGRLSRYCNAANSELVFANAVIVVEGEGDFAVVEKLLARHCGAPGGHYGLGITVIEAGGIDTMKYLVQLAHMFGVRSYTVTDKDGLKKTNGKRKLLEVLAQRGKPADDVLNQIRAEADRVHTDLPTSLASQTTLNSLLRPFDAFTMNSDLEGLILETYGQSDLATKLGPDGDAMIGDSEVRTFTAPDTGYARFSAWLGSKGWNCDLSTTNKLAPHLPATLLSDWLKINDKPNEALSPLDAWLLDIVRAHDRTPL
ncbi:AAA family ATPase [Microbacterium sp.]|uniref:ATP-dependent nuclease n=1 Tax=Microbacterium sp. TaxID=51671 RepID=UPI0028987F69|nr:AAA family ATPase [Microbacterium sp.]